MAYPTMLRHREHIDTPLNERPMHTGMVTPWGWYQRVSTLFSFSLFFLNSEVRETQNSLIDNY